MTSVDGKKLSYFYGVAFQTMCLQIVLVVLMFRDQKLYKNICLLTSLRYQQFLYHHIFEKKRLYCRNKINLLGFVRGLSPLESNSRIMPTTFLHISSA